MKPGQFECGVCHEVVAVEEGGNDDHPEACLSCWSALEACIKEADRIQHLPFDGTDQDARLRGEITVEYRAGWRDAAAIIVGRLRLIAARRQGPGG